MSGSPMLGTGTVISDPREPFVVLDDHMLASVGPIYRVAGLLMVRTDAERPWLYSRAAVPRWAWLIRARVDPVRATAMLSYLAADHRNALHAVWLAGGDDAAMRFAIETFDAETSP